MLAIKQLLLPQIGGNILSLSQSESCHVHVRAMRQMKAGGFPALGFISWPYPYGLKPSDDGLATFFPVICSAWYNMGCQTQGLQAECAPPKAIYQPPPCDNWALPA